MKWQFQLIILLKTTSEVIMKVIFAALLLISTLAQAEVFNELIYEDPTYSLVLTTNLCPVPHKLHPENSVFTYYARVYNSQAKGQGCWFKDGELINVWYFEEELVFIGSYREHLFKPHVKAEL